MKLSASVGLLFLIAVIRMNHSLISEPCLLNRLEELNCTFRTANTPEPDDNEQGIYSTRIQGNAPRQLTCDIRRRHSQVLPIQTFEEDERLMFLYSPGFELEDPQDYGTQMIVFYNVACPPDHTGVFTFNKIDMEGTTCLDDRDEDRIQNKCETYVLVRPLDPVDFGALEVCGSITNLEEVQMPTSNSGKFDVVFRTSDTNRFPGFKATVTCTPRNNQGRRKRTTTAAANFESELQRQIDYIERQTRYYKHLGYLAQYRRWFPFLLRIETVIIKFGESFVYSNNVITIQQIDTSRSFPSVTTLKVLNADEEVTVFRGSAEDKEWKLISLTGPGTLTVVGCSAFYQGFIPSQRGILPLTEEQREVFIALTTSAFRGVLEPPEQSLRDCPEVLVPPPFNFSTFPVFDPINDSDTSIPECSRPNTTIPVICNFTDDELLMAVANENSESILVRTVVDIALSCTRRVTPGRLEDLLNPDLEADCSISSDGLSFFVTCSANIDTVRVRSCSVVDVTGRSVSLDRFCRFPSFEFPTIGSGTSPGRQTLFLELQNVVNPGSSVTEEINFFLPLLVRCSSRFRPSRFGTAEVICLSNQERLTVTRCVLDGRTTLEICVFPSFLVSTRGLSPGQHSVTISFRDDELRSVTLTVPFAVSGVPGTG